MAYLDYFRSRIISGVEGLSDHDRRSSALPSGWTPRELLKHLTYVERRWLQWGFEGRSITDPWGDHRRGRWHVDDDESTDSLVEALRAQANRTTEVVGRHDLDDRGQPGERWDGADPPTLERVLFHLVQEYARHLGHLDIVVELSKDASIG